MFRRAGLSLLVLLISGVAYGITALPAYTIFYLPGSGKEAPQPFIELYWQVDPNSVHFSKNEKSIWIGKIKTELEIKCDTGTIVSEKYYLQTTPAASLLAAQLQNIMDMHRYRLPKGKVYISLDMSEDGHEYDAYSYTDSIVVGDSTGVFYSQLQLLDTSYATDLKDNIFYKNGNLQIPKCFNFLDDNKSVLHYYTELYNTNSISTDMLPIMQEVSISKKAYDYPVYGLVQRDTIKAGMVLPVKGRFTINVLPSGNYYLNTTLVNKNKEPIAMQSLFFQQSNANPVKHTDTTGADSSDSVFEKVNFLDLSTTFAGKYNVAQLMAIMKMLRPIANESEIPNIEGFLKKPDETYMRYFVYNFWKSRTLSDPEDAWKKYTQKIKSVNKLFGAGRKPGYETERGVVYLKYGEPDQRYVVSNEEGTWPYEIWQYNAPGNQSTGGVVLFYNPGFMIGDYQMLHATIRGELSNTQWRTQLYKSGNSSGNTNSRAEQLLQTR